jgi:AcrR family transcriptional regulator
VDAAIHLFADRGFEAVSLRDIAGLAGLTHGLLRHHFGSKQDLWFAAVEAIETRFRGALTILDEEGGDPLQQARHLVEHLTELSQRYPEVSRMLFHEAVNGGPRLDAVSKVMRLARSRVNALAKRLHASGHMQQHDPAELFLLLLITTSAPFAFPALVADIAGTKLSREKYGSALAKTLFGSL